MDVRPTHADMRTDAGNSTPSARPKALNLSGCVDSMAPTPQALHTPHLINGTNGRSNRVRGGTLCETPHEIRSANRPTVSD